MPIKDETTDILKDLSVGSAKEAKLKMILKFAKDFNSSIDWNRNPTESIYIFDILLN